MCENKCLCHSKRLFCRQTVTCGSQTVSSRAQAALAELFTLARGTSRMAVRNSSWVVCLQRCLHHAQPLRAWLDVCVPSLFRNPRCTTIQLWESSVLHAWLPAKVWAVSGVHQPSVLQVIHTYIHTCSFGPRPIGRSVASAVQPVLRSRGRCFKDRCCGHSGCGDWWSRCRGGWFGCPSVAFGGIGPCVSTAGL